MAACGWTADTPFQFAALGHSRDQRLHVRPRRSVALSLPPSCHSGRRVTHVPSCARSQHASVFAFPASDQPASSLPPLVWMAECTLPEAAGAGLAGSPPGPAPTTLTARALWLSPSQNPNSGPTGAFTPAYLAPCTLCQPTSFPARARHLQSLSQPDVLARRPPKPSAPQQDPGNSSTA